MFSSEHYRYTGYNLVSLHSEAMTLRMLTPFLQKSATMDRGVNHQSLLNFETGQSKMMFFENVDFSRVLV